MCGEGKANEQATDSASVPDIRIANYRHASQHSTLKQRWLGKGQSPPPGTRVMLQFNGHVYRYSGSF